MDQPPTPTERPPADAPPRMNFKQLIRQPPTIYFLIAMVMALAVGRFVSPKWTVEARALETHEKIIRG